MLLAFAIALLVSLLSTPLARRLAFTIGVMDQPAPRKIHRAPLPLLGGVSIVFGILGGFFLAPTGVIVASGILAGVFDEGGALASLAGLVAVGGFHWGGAGVSSESTSAVLQWPILLGGIWIFALGLIDDAGALRPRTKLLHQSIGACLAVLFGSLRIGAVTFPGGMIELGPFAAPLAVLWIVALVNAWNLLDGMDGLAAGVAVIAASALGFRAASNGDIGTGLLYSSIAGACAGFLLFNFHPARIFMGDCGSLLLGYLFAVGTLLDGTRAHSAAPFPIEVPILIFAIPVLDTTAAVIRRGGLYLEMRRLWSSPLWEALRVLARADQRHLHHGLLRRGFSQTKAAVFLYLLAGALGVLAISFPLLPVVGAWATLGTVVFGGWMLARVLGSLRHQHGRTATKDDEVLRPGEEGVALDGTIADLIRKAS